MALSGVIDAFKTGTYLVSRHAAATYDVNGNLVIASPTLLNIDMCIQPVSGRDLQALPEGHHATDLRRAYSKTELFTRTPSNDPDFVAIGAEIWEVITVSAWEGFGLGSGADHYDCLIARYNQP